MSNRNPSFDARLLDIPERAGTILPELYRFFHDTSDTSDESDDGGVSGHDQFERFLCTFAGTSFVMPDPPGELPKIRRDQQIIDDLGSDQSVANQLALCSRHSLSHAYLQNIWGACMGRNLQAPAIRGGREAAIAEAVSWLKRHPELVNDIAMIYTLDAKERARAVDMAATSHTPPTPAHQTHPTHPAHPNPPTKRADSSKN